MVRYACNEALPASIIQALPQSAQTLYRNAYNSAWAQHVMPIKRALAISHAQVADRAGWTAVKRLYVLEKGQWLWRGEPPRPQRLAADARTLR